jgi:hypothetical protein
MARRLGLLALLAALAVPGSASAAVFSNTDPIALPDNSVANPYPSNIPVSGLQGTVVRVRVTLVGVLAAAWNVDALLVNPSGDSAIVVSDACNNTDYGNITLTFDDSAASMLGPGPCPGLAGGTFKPTNYDTLDTFPAAPPGPHAIGFSTFSGGVANGIWKLYAVDDQISDSGAINGGWSLDVTTTGGPPAKKKKCKKKKRKAAAAKKKRCGKKKRR